MSESGNSQDTVNVMEETLSVGTIVNQALIDILIAKRIISTEELVSYIGKINLAEKNMVHGTT